MKDKWAMCAMGAWLTGTIIVSVVATENFYTIDRLLAQSPNSAFTAVAERLGSGETRDLLRYLSSELNRLYFQLWNVTQFALGALVFWLLAGHRAAARARWGVASMLALVLLMIVWPHYYLIKLLLRVLVVYNLLLVYLIVLILPHQYKMLCVNK